MNIRKKIIVTGGSGFIGTSLIHLLTANGSEVLNIDLNPPKVMCNNSLTSYENILNYNALSVIVKDFNPDYIFHLGARTDMNGKSLSEYSENIKGVYNLIKSSKYSSNLQRIVFLSSRLVFKIDKPPKNDWDYSGNTNYGKSKIIGEKIIREYCNHVPWVILRPTSIWGPWFSQPYNLFFSLIRDGNYFQPGQRKVLKSFGYVENTVYQIIKFSLISEKHVNGRAFFLSDYDPIEIIEWSEMIRSAFNAPVIKKVPLSITRLLAAFGTIAKNNIIDNFPITTFKINNFLQPMIYDTKSTEDIVGPLPFSLEEGVKKTVAWMLERDPRQA